MKTVLVIEDEPNICEALRFILSREGWRVDITNDGATAMDVLRSGLPDMLILDVMLPNMSGFDILRALRAQDATRDLPVLMLTAKGQAADRHEAERIGVTRFMSKPFANAEIVDAVRQLVPQ